MERWTRWVLRHRLLVVLFWLVVAVAGAVNAGRTVDRLSYDFDLPGQPAFETNQHITAQFGGGGVDDPLLLVVNGSSASSTATSIAQVLPSVVPGARVVSPADSAVLAPDPSTAVVVVYPPVTPGAEPYAASQPALERLAAQTSTSRAQVRLTGFPIVSEGGGGSDRGILVEVLLGAVGALVVLALVFASLLAAVPLLVAAVSILGTFLALLGLTTITDVSFVVQYLVALIGLGVAIDYSLLVVTRWREERAPSSGSSAVSDEEAVVAAMVTAGRAVLFSGTTVAVSLAALVAVPVPFLRGIGLGGLLIPLLSVAVSLSLTPVVLSTVGARLTWPRRRHPATTTSRFWTRVAHGVLRHRWWTIAGCVVVLLALAAPVATLTLGTAQLLGVASSTPASTALTDAVAAGLPGGVPRPTEVVVPDEKVQTALMRLGGVPGVSAAVAPTGPGWRNGGQAVVDVYSSADPASDAGRDTLDGIRAVAVGDASVGGTPAEDADFVTAVYGHVVWVLLAVAVVTFLLLARALRSLWLPIKALVLNVISIGAAYGVTVWIWQDGHGSDLVFGQPASGVITTWVPIAAFSFLFGLSMDYEVFILSRMRESYDDRGDPDGTDAAVVDGIAHTGRLVTSAAAILFLAFVALSTVPTVDVKILATALALGIVIDAVVVRGLLAPALVGVLGRANWTTPAWLRRVLFLREA